MNLQVCKTRNVLDASMFGCCNTVFLAMYFTEVYKFFESMDAHFPGFPRHGPLSLWSTVAGSFQAMACIYFVN